MKIAGNSRNPTSESTGSVSTSATPATTSITITPTAIGSGAIGNHTASTSAFALESSCPVGCWLCHDSGSRRYCRVTSRRYLACSRYCMTPAPSRRPTIPAALSTATPRISAAAPARAPAVVSPSLNAGTITSSVIRPSTQADATVMKP